ncbi:MAG: prepilin-type N-terminal cleavage/methylation domain-containing protein [Candidatus Komeilibacteria bacterium]|nr:prepilin-type N-terminal cleavage/methylation domain-containing protein [Candidatus Komeilibacteria bacterium]
MNWVRSNNGGGSLVEVIVAIAILALFLSGATFLIVENTVAVQSMKDRQTANAINQGMVNALYSIRSNDWSSLVNGSYGVSDANGQWELVKSNSTIATGKFRGYVTIADAYRDGNDSLVPAASGTLDRTTKLVDLWVSWADLRGKPQLTQNTTYLVKIKDEVVPEQGLLVFTTGFSGPATYRTFDLQSRTWGPKETVWGPMFGEFFAPFGMYRAQLYSSPARDEKILLFKDRSSKLSGNSVFSAAIFSQGQWVSNQVLVDAWDQDQSDQNLDGTYLANGDFMVVYVDTANAAPKFRIWNGSSWSAAVTMRTLQSRPRHIVVRSRPGTNEVMAVFQSAQKTRIETMYFNGAAYTQSNWTLHSLHATDASTVNPSVDFAWSKTNILIGGMVYSDGKKDKAMDIKIWTANGTGGGSWSSTSNAPAATPDVGPVQIVSHKNEDRFAACYQGLSPTRTILCYTSDFTPAWTVPANNVIATAEYNQKGFDMSLEALDGLQALMAYSDVSAPPDFSKKLDAASLQWDAVGTAINPLIERGAKFRLIPNAENNDVMLLIAQRGINVHSIAWNGATNTFYSIPAGLADTDHGGAGGVNNEQWFDFVWK